MENRVLTPHSKQTISHVQNIQGIQHVQKYTLTVKLDYCTADFFKDLKASKIDFHIKVDQLGLKMTGIIVSLLVCHVRTGRS